jgi:hypothetical protein
MLFYPGHQVTFQIGPNGHSWLPVFMPIVEGPAWLPHVDYSTVIDYDSVNEKERTNCREILLQFISIRQRQQDLPLSSNGLEVKRRKKLIAFGWYGGKYSHLEWLLPLLPECHHYCEPFGGSAAVLLNRSPSPVETFNDIDGEIVNFFRVLRNNKNRLLRAITLTPFSREEFFIACSMNGGKISNLERARRFFIRARQVRTGLAQTASIGRWANCKNTTRAGMAGAV